MSITKAPFYPLAGFWMDKSLVEAVYDVDGQKCHIRQLGRHVFYHLEDADSIEQTRFVCCDSARGLRDWPSKDKEGQFVEAEEDFTDAATGNQLTSNEVIPRECFATQVQRLRALRRSTRSDVYPEAVFTAQVRRGESGRYALHTSKVFRDCAVIMFLRRDGTGICLHDAEGLLQDRPEAHHRIAFHWDGRPQGIARHADILNAPWQCVSALCDDVLTHQVCPRMADPFLSYAHKPDERFEYVCGSEQELERLTRCILHIHPRLFDWMYDPAKTHLLERTGEGGITTRYRATTSQEAGGPYAPLQDERLRLLEIAFEYNTFQGGEWRLAYNRAAPRRISYKMQAFERHFYAPPPSAHEQAEALLFLYDWLEDKVTEKERRRLLRLDASALTENKHT